MLPNKLVISSLVDIQHFMIIDCSDGWIMKYYIFWMYRSAPYVLIQEVFWNSNISSLLSRIVDKIQNSKLMQRNIPTNLFGCLYSLLKKKLHFGILFLHLVMKFKRNKLQFNSHNVDMHPHYLDMHPHYLNYYKFC